MAESCAVAILDFRAVIEGPAELVAEFRAVRPSWPATGSSRITTHFRVSPELARPGYCQLEQDGRVRGVPRRHRHILADLDRAVNAAAVAWLEPRHLLMHAGAVAYQGRGCLLPAPSGSGKTTLVAALIAAGFEYFSDEVAVLDRGSGMLWPFPKPLGIKSGSRRVLAPAYPALRAGLPRRWIDGRALWQLPPPIGALPTRSVPVCAVVLPRYHPHSRTLLTPIAATEALPDVLHQVPNPREHDGQDFRALVRILGAACCYRLTFGRLATAVDAIKHVLGVGSGPTALDGRRVDA